MSILRRAREYTDSITAVFVQALKSIDRSIAGLSASVNELSVLGHRLEKALTPCALVEVQVYGWRRAQDPALRSALHPEVTVLLVERAMLKAGDRHTFRMRAQQDINVAYIGVCAHGQWEAVVYDATLGDRIIWNSRAGAVTPQSLPTPGRGRGIGSAGGELSAGVDMSVTVEVPDFVLLTPRK